MLKAFSLLETIFAIVIISIAILAGVTVYTKVLSSSISITRLQMEMEMEVIYTTFKQKKEPLEKTFTFKNFEVLKKVDYEETEHLYRLKLIGILGRDTIVKKYIVYENQ